MREKKEGFWRGGRPGGAEKVRVQGRGEEKGFEESERGEERRLQHVALLLSEEDQGRPG